MKTIKNIKTKVANWFKGKGIAIVGILVVIDIIINLFDTIYWYV